MRKIVILLLLIPCQILALFVPLRVIWALMTNEDEKAWAILKGYDRLGNVAMNGDGRETISSRANRARQEGERWGCILCKVLDAFEKDHCENAGDV